ncbi:MAG TPA: hypothetical protein VK841_03480 [Polyangiaceae bacterium]|jgi:hypothetical protein|nr:hypothetical protein [Polyangiaceae bacterium]
MDASWPAKAVLRPRFGAAWVALGALLPASCVSAPRMCVSEPDCGSQASCVAGRCLHRGAVAAVTTAKRWLFAPVDVGFVARGGANGAEPGPHATPVTVALGRGDGATALFRFAIALPPDATVLEAYVLLREDADVDADPVPLALHAARITTPWRGDAVTWAEPPRIVEAGSPVTRVVPWPGRAVRIDVHDIVARWRRRPEEDFGIAVLCEGATASASATGIPLAMGPMAAGGAPGSAPVDGPALELYVK